MEERSDVVRRAFAAFSARDLDTFLDLIDPDVELLPSGTAAIANDGRPYKGARGIEIFFRDVATVWEELEITAHAYREVGDHVLVRGRVYGRAGGGHIVDSPAHWVWRVVDGKISWGAAFATEGDAELAAWSPQATGSGEST
jgi:ketosteroid isomerase-like protein